MTLSIEDRLREEGHGFADLPPFLSSAFSDVVAAKAQEFEALIEEGRTITRKALQRTLDAGLSHYDSFIRKMDSGGIVIPGTSFFEPVINPGVAEFLRGADESGIPYQVWLHPPSKTKLDVGYSPEEVAITLAYAPDEARNYYLLFNRHSKAGERLPRRIVKDIIGAKDLMKAAEQAKKNLEGRMSHGYIGPFGIGQNDLIYIDMGSYDLSERSPNSSVNFSAGTDYLSFNMRLSHAVRILEKPHPHNIKIYDFWGNFNGEKG